MKFGGILSPIGLRSKVLAWVAVTRPPIQNGRCLRVTTLRALRRIVTAHPSLIGADAATFMKFVISDSYL